MNAGEGALAAQLKHYNVAMNKEIREGCREQEDNQITGGW